MSTRHILTAILAFSATLQLTGLAATSNVDAKAQPSAPQTSAIKCHLMARVLPTEPVELKKYFDKLVENYFTAAFKAHPDWGTQVGDHANDNAMETFSQQSINDRIAELNGFVSQFNAIPAEKLTKNDRMDRELLIANAKGELLELQEIQQWKHNPDRYSSNASSGIFDLMRRKFAPPEVRLRSVIAREKLMPELFANAKQNLSHTPKIYTQIALEQLPGIISFFQSDVPKAFTDVKDEALLKEFNESNAAAVSQLQNYQQFLKEKVLPASVDNFAIGKDAFQKKLAYDEMVTEPVDSLLKKGYDELHRLQKEFIATAKKIDPNKDAQAVYAEISSEHPKPDELLSSVSGILNHLRDECSHYVDLPNKDQLKVEETPPFMRATTFASMDSPGALETVDRQAYYQVTLPEKDWDAKRTEEHMRFFCTRDVINTSVHEAFPGHFVQFLWTANAPTKTRKLLWCSSNAEGWAHYCEEMMVDNDLGKNDPKLKLVQLHDALLRASRYIVGIEMHTNGWTLDQGKQFFISEGYQEPANADRESKRGTQDPTYLVYTLGKLQILSLRDEYQKKMGSKFSLKDFHNKFLAQGGVPIKLVREAMFDTTN